MSENDKRELENIQYNMKLMQERLTQLGNQNESQAIGFSKASLNLYNCLHELEKIHAV